MTIRNSPFYDEDGIDGPFERAMNAEMQEGRRDAECADCESTIDVDGVCACPVVPFDAFDWADEDGDRAFNIERDES